MSLYAELQRASYKQVEFLIETDSKSAGKNVIIHKYPNSDKQYVEELGKKPATFSATIVIAERPGGNGLLSDLKKVESILAAPGAGDFVHPVYGLLNNIVCVSYDTKYTQREIGKFKISAEFTYTWTEVEQPAETTTSESTITNNLTNVKSSLSTAVANKITVPTTAAGITGLVNKITDVLDVMNGTITSIINPITSNLSAWSNMIYEITSRIYTTIGTATLIKGIIADIISTYSNLVSIPTDAKKALVSLLDYGSTAGSIIFDKNNLVTNESSRSINPVTGVITGTSIRTIDEQTISNNNNVLDEFVRVLVLSSLYEVAAYDDYNTEAEIDKIKEILESNFQFQMNIAPKSIPTNLISSIAEESELREYMYILKYNTLKVLNNKTANKWKIESLNVGLTSVLLETYHNYSNLDNLEQMQILNNAINNTNTKESIVRMVE